jgi:hypothetical protein
MRRLCAILSAARKMQRWQRWHASNGKIWLFGVSDTLK